MTQLLVDRTMVDGCGEIAPAAVPATPAPRARRTPARPQPGRQVRPGRSRRGSGRSSVPTLRPAAFWVAPDSARRSGAVRSCTPAAPVLAEVAVSRPTWRLTDRGVAVVLVVGLMIMVAALTVVGLTAMSVTGEGHQVSVSASLPR